VARLSEFSTLFHHLLREGFSKFQNVAHILRATFFPNQIYALVLTKKIGMGYILGDFLTNSSGHPAPQPPQLNLTL
jgi:hypothetical protein